MKFFYSLLNDLMPAVLFITATILVKDYFIFGCIVMILAYFSLDVHTYVSKKLGFYNNVFFKKS